MILPLIHNTITFQCFLYYPIITFLIGRSSQLQGFTDTTLTTRGRGVCPVADPGGWEEKAHLSITQLIFDLILSLRLAS